MTIIRGISLDSEEKDSFEVNVGGQTGLTGGSVLRLPRQNSLLPDFSSLPNFDNLLTPNSKSTAFDFEQSLYGQETSLNSNNNNQFGIMDDAMKPKNLSFNFDNIQDIKEEQLSPEVATTTDAQLASFITSVTQASSQISNQSMNQTSQSATTFQRTPLESVKQESLDSENEMVTFNSDGSYQMYGNRTAYPTSDDPSSPETESALMELQGKISKASRELNMPKNPWLWSCEQVNKWIHWLFTTSYEMEPAFTLNLDGTNLCLAKDLHLRVNNQQGAADIIRIEIDLWMQAYSIEQQWQQKLQQSALTQTEERVYTDLSESRPSQQAPSSRSSISVIPTPVSTTSNKTTLAPITTQSTPLAVPPPAHMRSNLQQHPTYPTIPSTASSPQHLHQQHSPINMVSSMTLNQLHQQELNQQLAFEYQSGVMAAHHLVQQQMRPSTLPIHIQPMSQASPTPVFSQGWDSPRSCESDYSGNGSQHMDYSSMEEDSRECSPAPQRNVPRGPLPHSRNSIKLWQFLRNLLDNPGLTCIRWVDREKGVFKIEDSQKVAKLWGQRKNRPAMNYDKLSRSIRQYYKKKIIKKTDNSKRLVYQFCAPYL